MSDATRQFSLVVSAVPVMNITARPLEETILRTCDCMDEKLIPHYVYANGWECSVCGKQTIRNDRLELSAGR